MTRIQELLGRVRNVFGRTREHPSIRLATKEECGDEEHDYFAQYDTLANEIVLTDNCTSDVAVRAIVHEITHWAQSLALTPRERRIEAGVYDKNLEKFGAAVWLDYSLIERMATFVEENCLEE